MSNITLTNIAIKPKYKHDRFNVWWGFDHHNEVNLESLELLGDTRRLTNINLERAEALELAETLLRAVRELDARETATTDEKKVKLTRGTTSVGEEWRKGSEAGVHKHF